MVMPASIQLNYIHREADRMDILQFHLFLDSFSWKRAYFSNKFGFYQLQRVIFSAVAKPPCIWGMTSNFPLQHVTPTWTVQRKKNRANFDRLKMYTKPIILDIESKEKFPRCMQVFIQSSPKRCTEWCFPNHKIFNSKYLPLPNFCGLIFVRPPNSRGHNLLCCLVWMPSLPIAVAWYHLSHEKQGPLVV